MALETLELRSADTVTQRVALDAIPGIELTAKAIQVTLAGCHGIILSYERGAPAIDILRAVHRIAKEEGLWFRGMAIPICRCGYFGMVDERCRCPWRQITAHFRQTVALMPGHDVSVNVFRPSARTPSTGELEATIMTRVRRARASTLCPPTDWDGGCREVMDHYLHYFGAGRVRAIERVAVTIARLEGSPMVQVPHMTAAIEYQAVWSGLKDFLPESGVPVTRLG